MQRYMMVAAIAVAITISCIDALSISQTNNIRQLGTSSTTSRVGYHGVPQSILYAPSKLQTNTQLSMSISSHNSNNEHSRHSNTSNNIRNKVQSTVTKISSRISRRTRTSDKRFKKRDLVKQKFITAAMAFSALFFISTGREADLFSSSSTSSSATASSATASSVIARGGGVSTTNNMKPSGILNTIKSQTVNKHTTSSSSSSQQQPISPVYKTIYNKWDDLRGGASSKSKSSSSVEEVATQTTKTFKDAITELSTYMKGPKSDTLFLLFATAMITPLCKLLGTSPILGFLASGMLLGPNGFGLISGIHTTETLAELGIVFFLFEMGIELSVERLKSMKKDVFGLGLSQYSITALILGLCAKFIGGLSGPASVVVGGALSLSSSAFVLQLIKDKKELATRFGKASFGVLLLQDLAVVPLLVATPILAGSGSLASALGSAVVKAGMALSGIALAGRFALQPIFKTVAAANSQEAFLGVILFTSMGMSFLTEGLGLSNTLGAFLAGVLLSETKYRYQVEADIAPFRGILLGLFFVTVGFEIDVGLIANNLPVVGSIVAGILFIKAGILTLLSKGFGLSNANAMRTGLILSQGGEFAFVAFALARSCGILDPATTKMLLTSVSLTMALTPFLDDMGGKIAKKMEEGADFTHYMGQDDDALEITDNAKDSGSGFVVVVGYGIVGKVVCELLDAKFIKYEVMEKNPKKAIDARNKGLPVFYGDIGRQEVAEAFSVDKAKAVIVCISEKAEATRAVIALRRMYPDKPIFARAKDADHAQRLQSTLDVAAMVPILPEDNLLLTLPFGGAVLRSLGAPAEEVNAILAEKRREVLSGKELEKFEEETVLAQLGVANPDDKEDEEDEYEEEEKKEKDETPSEKIEAEDSSIDIEDEDAEVEDCVIVSVKSEEGGEAKPSKSLVRQVVEANVSPEMKETLEKEAESSEEGVECSGGTEQIEASPEELVEAVKEELGELREKEMEPYS